MSLLGFGDFACCSSVAVTHIIEKQKHALFVYLLHIDTLLYRMPNGVVFSFFLDTYCILTAAWHDDLRLSLQLHTRLHKLEQERRQQNVKRMEAYTQQVALEQLKVENKDKARLAQKLAELEVKSLLLQTMCWPLSARLCAFLCLLQLFALFVMLAPVMLTTDIFLLRHFVLLLGPRTQKVLLLYLLHNFLSSGSCFFHPIWRMDLFGNHC